MTVDIKGLGKIIASKEVLNEIYIHNNNIKDWTIIVDTKKDIYAWGYDVFTVVMNRDDYVWFKFR